MLPAWGQLVWEPPTSVPSCHLALRPPCTLAGAEVARPPPGPGVGAAAAAGAATTSAETGVSLEPPSRSLEVHSKAMWAWLKMQLKSQLELSSIHRVKQFLSTALTLLLLGNLQRTDPSLHMPVLLPMGRDKPPCIGKATKLLSMGHRLPCTKWATVLLITAV